MTRRSAEVDAHLARATAPQRRSLQELRRAIQAAAPAALECIAYGIPAFRLDGKFLVGFAALKRHCSFFPGAAPLEVHAAALRRFDCSKGTIRFQPDDPLPAPLVRKLVRARIAAMEAGSKRA